MDYIGIDISKKSFTVAFSSAKNSRVDDYENSPKGIRKFIKRLPHDTICVMEATGNYGTLLVYMLNESSYSVVVESPLKVKNFARAMLSVTKTDAIDARLLVLYGERMQPLCYKVPSKELLMLKQKRTILRQLKKQLIINKNMQESTLNLPFIDPTVKKTLCKVISFLEKSIKDMEQSLTSSTEDVFSEQFKLLTSIKEIGATLATALIITTGCFSQFDNSRQLTRYLGLSPTYEQSGTSVNRRGHINKNGDSDLRCQIYVTAWSASQHNPACNELYIKLRSNGKPSKVAMIAVANKLVRQAFAIVKSGKEYYPSYKRIIEV